MHADALPIDAALVGSLLNAQCPDLAGWPLREQRTTGTVNAVFRAGERWYVRLPRTVRWAADLERERRWLPLIAKAVALQVPEPVFRGHPTADYPCPWAVYRWIDGAPYADGRVADEVAAAVALAGFVSELRELPTDGAPTAGRRPLAELDAATREALAAAPEVDRVAALAAWSSCRAAPVWAGVRRWIHGDLLRPNLLVRDGALAAVLDFGAAGAGDPAHDLIAAWAVFGPAGRAAYRERLDPGDGSWERARGIALHQAALIIPYYRHTNPGFVALAVRTIEQILLDRT